MKDIGPFMIAVAIAVGAMGLGALYLFIESVWKQR